MPKKAGMKSKKKKKMSLETGTMDIYSGMKKFLIHGQWSIISQKDVSHRHTG